MNKKFFATLLVVLLIFVAFPAFCGGTKEKTVEEPVEEEVVVVNEAPVVEEELTSTISAPVARVSYGDSTYTIKREEVQALISSAKESGVDLSEEDAIMNLISQLLLQMKLNELISSYSQDELSQIGLYAIASEAKNYYNIELSQEEDFEKYCQTYHNATLQDYWAYSLQNYLFMSFLYSEYSDIFEKYAVTDEYVNSVYNSYIEKDPSTFEVGPFASVAHILFAFSDDEAKNATLKRATDTLGLIKSGKMTFEEAVANSDDKSTKDNEGVVPGYAEKDSEILSYYFGSKASDAIFALKEGEVSEIIEGPVGYHIIKLVDFVDKSVLGLDDSLSPGSEQTLRDYIAYQISIELESEASSVAQNKLISDLMNQAEIKRFN